MNKKKLIIFGAGGNADVICSTIEDLNQEVNENVLKFLLNYKEYFDLRDSNEVLDIKLKEQNLTIDLSKKKDDLKL